jgi:energy-converting hydrogenase B subunit D
VIALQLAVVILAGLAATATVLTRDLVRLAMVSSAYGLVLVVFFVVLQAPDVALSQLVVGAVASPLITLVAVVLQRRG